MTFLESVCEQLMGPPARHSGNGESYWQCPFHEDSSPSFHTLPHKPEYRDRWKCFGCGMRGDDADLIKEFYPGEDWPRRRTRLEKWRREYEAKRPESKPSFLLRGPGRARSTNPQKAYERDPMEDGFTPEASSALDMLLAYINEPPMDSEFRELLVAQKALEICAQYGLHPGGFAILCRFEFDGRDWEVRHLAECDDPNCDAIVCRAKRGLPSLTKNEIEAGRREAQEARRQRTERVRRSVKKPPSSRRKTAGQPTRQTK